MLICQYFCKYGYDHRCRSRQIFRDAKDFCPNFPKLSRKVFVRLSRQIFSHKDHEDLFWYDVQKRLSCVFLQTLGAIFENKATLDAIFARISKMLGSVLASSPPAPLVTEQCSGVDVLVRFK